MFKKLMCIILAVVCLCAVGCTPVATEKTEYEKFLELPQYTRADFKPGLLKSSPKLSYDTKKAGLFSDAKVILTVNVDGYEKTIEYSKCNLTLNYKIIVNYEDHTSQTFMGSETFTLDFVGDGEYKVDLSVSKNVYSVEVHEYSFDYSGYLTKK